jgi:D-beta-D-heptose 7-phosphate kinase/D-beta-D-heptose 1-phosphate adenosyltransferase
MRLMVKVWTNGCFDVLHRGHIELFKYAKSLGNWVVVGLDSDEKIKKDKGSNRPFNTYEDRREVLLSIKYIDEVWQFNSRNGLIELIKQYEPDILVIGSDWKGRDVVGDDIVDDVRFFDRVGDYSTSEILGVV